MRDCDEPVEWFEIDHGPARPILLGDSEKSGIESGIVGSGFYRLLLEQILDRFLYGIGRRSSRPSRQGRSGENQGRPVVERQQMALDRLQNKLGRIEGLPGVPVLGKTRFQSIH